MASSSSLSGSTPASSSQSWIHDVFLSFRGEDTRKTFVDHLYSALVEKGIRTYKDDQTLPRGESIGPSLLKAIEESRIAIIVFSKNYANSSWCLDELAYIMKCMDERRQIVMPIFYHVDPSEVRKQKRKYGEAFDKHESENNNKVESWRKALTDAGNLAGWEPTHIANGHEAKCIKEIVDTVFDRLLSFISNVNKDLIGIETRLQDLKSRLEIGSGGVRMVGIWGVGGGGKTTLASSVYMEISRQFEGYCFLENIREESSKYGLKKLQEKILLAILKTQVVVQSDEEGRHMIKSRLCYRNVFIVLDDVDDLDQLEALVGSHDWFGEGSRIIITTRDEHLLRTHRVNVIYDVSLLSSDEAIQLFRRHAYREYKPVEDFEMLSLDVISYAGGLPLAIKILGSFLYDKDKNEWMSALAKLKDIPNPRIMDKLKISYDGLQRDEKELFLDIACFFRKEDKDKAMMTLDACGFHPVIGVKVLIQKSLITVSSYGRFDMHDLVQEMGHYIVRGEDPKNPGKHSRVWCREEFLNICAMDSVTDHEKIEALRSSFIWDDSSQRLHHVVGNMKKLRWISLRGYHASSLPKTFQPTELCCLQLELCTQKQLWEGYKYLPSLKVMHLRFMDKLISTPDFKGLPCLERLILDTCNDLKEIHPSIGYHERLVVLNVSGCSKLKMLPPIVRMKRLETLHLSYCYRLHKFPKIQMNMDSLVKLYLKGSGIEIFPSSIGQYCTNLVSLDLSYCEHLKSIEGNFRPLKRLKELHLKGCARLEKLAEDLFDVECCLEVLSLCTKSRSPSFEDSISFKNVMNSIALRFFHQDLESIKLPHFPRFLRRLYLNGCNLVDGNIHYDIRELSNLEVLDLSDNNFSRLPFSLSQLSRLKFLNISICKRLVEFPDLPSSIAILKASWCDSLETVGDLSNYKWLWKVSISRTNKAIDGERVLQSMLQGNAIEDHFMSLILYGSIPPRSTVVENRTFTLQLPQNWYNDFNGFLISVQLESHAYTIIIKQEMHMDSQCDHWEEFDKSLVLDTHTRLGYVSFGSLRHTSWWNTMSSKISFSVKDQIDKGIEFKVGLVPKRSKGDPMERAKGARDCSEFWDDQNNKTFKIQYDSKSSIEISWIH